MNKGKGMFMKAQNELAGSGRILLDHSAVTQ